MSIPDSCRALVFDPATREFELQQIALRPLRCDEILVRVRLSAICGSDLHTISGRRDPGGPIVLGHEICGTVAAMGESVSADCLGAPLSVGDRVTWSIAASCGRCFYCARGIPQKCVSLFKYGHTELDTDTPLSGGFAEYCYLVPGTAVYRVPEEVPDPITVFANCSLATMAAAIRTAEVLPGQSVLIHGAGLVGLCAAAFCADRRAATVVMVDPQRERLARAGWFGATHTAEPQEVRDGSELRKITPGGRGFDVAIEACGVPDVVPLAIEALRTGGTYILAGTVYPGADVALDLHAVTTGMLRVFGQHNYTPRDLQDALDLLVRARDRFAFGRVVEAAYPLDQIDEALRHIEDQPGVLRVALEP